MRVYLDYVLLRMYTCGVRILLVLYFGILEMRILFLSRKRWFMFSNW